MSLLLYLFLFYLLMLLFFSFSIDIFMIIIIVFFVKYDAYNSFDLLIISIDFLYLKYQLDEFLFNLYIRYSSS